MCYRKDELEEAYQNLVKVKGKCSYSVDEECGVGELTVKQVAYLKIIATESQMTFSRLAELTHNSKPTITDMINRFADCGCVFKEKSPYDGRVSYIKLTERGKLIAEHELNIVKRLVDRMVRSLSDEEIDFLIHIFNKIK